MTGMYLYVGNFAMKPGLDKGLTVYGYDPISGGLSWIGDWFTDVNAGQQCFHEACGIDYITNEQRDYNGIPGCGGEVLAVKPDPKSGLPLLVSRKRSLFSQPSYICMNQAGTFAVVPHHGSDGAVSKLVRREDGTYDSAVLFDDGAVILFRLNEDGSLGDICDAFICPSDTTGHRGAHLHAAVMDPGGSMIVVTDKGTDRLYSFHLDESCGKLLLKHAVSVDNKSAPRYCAFHPTLPVFYQNHERAAYLNLFHYDSSLGTMEYMERVSLLPRKAMADTWNQEGPADILFHPLGKVLYVSFRTRNEIAVLEIDGSGHAVLMQNIDCGGKNPRGITLSPDARFLLAANRDSASIATFSVGEKGLLTDTGVRTKANLPGNMKFIPVGSYESTGGEC